MSTLLPAIPQNAPPEVQNDPIIKQFLKPSIKQILQGQNGDASILAKIGEAFSQQHTFNGAKTVDKYSEEDIARVQANVFEVIQKKYINYSLHEILYAFKCGMSGQYGEPIYFNTVSVNHWLAQYTETERKKSKREYYKALQKQADEIKPEPTEEERKQLQKGLLNGLANWIDKVQSECSELIQIGKFKPESISPHQYGHWWYKKLIELELMEEPTVVDRNTFYQKAIEQTKPGKGQHETAIMKAKNWLFRRQIYEWIKEDKPYRTMFALCDKLPGG